MCSCKHASVHVDGVEKYEVRARRGRSRGCCYPRRARSALGVDIVLTLDVCLYVCMYVSALERKRLIGMT